jgi:hypothetical protein
MFVYCCKVLLRGGSPAAPPAEERDQERPMAGWGEGGVARMSAALGSVTYRSSAVETGCERQEAHVSLGTRSRKRAGKNATQLTMIHLAPLLVGGPAGVVSGRCTLIVGPGLAPGPGGLAFVAGRPFHGFSCRHCLVDAAPIGSRGYATGVEFAAHLSRADGSSQVLATIRWPFRRSGCCGGCFEVLVPPRCLPALLLCCPSFPFPFPCCRCCRCLGCL